ncbi:MAG: hypothetical protein ACK5U7_10150 [Bacteroidota bacterium]|jgi:hypothetical protein
MIEAHEVSETVGEALAAWDAGKPVVTIEMGGMGDGYEHAIQSLAFEIIRTWQHTVPQGEEITDERWRLMGIDRDGIVARMDKEHGFSGAQVGAASNLAACVVRRGYRNAVMDSRLDADRRMWWTKSGRHEVQRA